MARENAWLCTLLTWGHAPRQGICVDLFSTCSNVRYLSTSHPALAPRIAQAIGKIQVNANELGVDYLTIVGHKFYGPRIGALFARMRPGGALVPLEPVFIGGGQVQH